MTVSSRNYQGDEWRSEFYMSYIVRGHVSSYMMNGYQGFVRGKGEAFREIHAHK